MVKNSARVNLQRGFIALPVLIVLIVIGSVVKIAHDKSVLGQKTYLAEGEGSYSPPSGGGEYGGSSAPSGGSSGGSAPSQPQQESQPQQQSQTQQQPSQPQTQPQQPGSGYTQEKMHQMQQQYQGGSNYRMPQTPSGQNNQPSQNQSGGQSGQGTRPSEQSATGEHQMGAQEQQKFQQLQQQWQQEASKFGFQIQTGSSNQGSEGASIQGNFNVGVRGGQGGQQQVNLNDRNTRFSFGSFQAVRADGSKFEIDKSAAERINAAIKVETGSEISQTGNTFSMKRGDITAKTELPLSFNVATKTFTVQTENGQEEEVNVLPDEAFSKIEDEDENFDAESGEAELKDRGTKPVYEIKGMSKQKIFGFLPISIAQTRVVSAQNGDTVATDQNFVSQILDAISF